MHARHASYNWATRPGILYFHSIQTISAHLFKVSEFLPSNIIACRNFSCSEPLKEGDATAMEVS